ncbi:CatB-related O-acetyltransferase [Pedobacter foliorum]|uniref:CatB-related O-acetyltransferase n=1 Tax=Pedobacter foliorum TaxID=2739058 RepID=UPI0037CAE09D
MVSFILKLVSNFFLSGLYSLKRCFLLAKNQTENPTSRFYNGSLVYNSKLGKYNVIFNHTNVGNSIIDSHTYIQKNSNVLNAKIGKYCSIASNVTIGPGLHRTDGISTHPAFFLKNTPLVKTYCKVDSFEANKQTEIGNDVWIGQNVVILDGVKIGNGAIIAAGAVVVKNIEPYSVVGGVPSKHIKYRFDAPTISLLEKSEWWNYPEDWFEKNGHMMRNSDEFINYLKCL